MCSPGYYKTSDANACSDIGCASCASQNACPGDNTFYSLSECNGRPGIYVKVWGNSNTRSVCEPCESGFYCPGDQTRYACRTCTADEIVRTECTSSSNGECIGKGLYWNGASAVQCRQCPQGSYVKTPCGLNDAVCEACEVGFYCFNGTKMECPPGSTSFASSSSYIHCHCKAGFNGTVYGPNNSTCVPCKIGTFCPGTMTVEQCSCA